MTQGLMFVIAGGALGSGLRYLVSNLATGGSERNAFPVGTLVVNLFGCLLIGFFADLAGRSTLFPEPLRLFLVPGLLGGFTTYSAFAWESSRLLASGQDGVVGVGYIVATVLGGLLAVAGGLWLSRMVVSGSLG